ncbi:MAG: cation:proton antiporter [Caldilineaceae bacterium]|nr:cation:proton antiporter [Caldilineaceae bacterium]
MHHNELLIIAGIVAVGFACQWLAWKAKLPAILPLLAVGLLAGPVGFGIIHPRDALGDLFFPFVSLSVSIILFEGALTLNFREVRNTATVVRNLLIFGTLISWFGGAAAAHYIMGLNWELSLLFGALIVVTGPTVIAPILRNVKPTESISSVLKWEGILIDPLGALLAVLVFDFIIADSSMIGGSVIGFFRIVVIGSALGLAAGYIAYLGLRYYLFPDYLRDFALIALVTLTFAVSNTLADESGLLAVTVMGVVLANTRLRQLREIWNFKEKLSVILISVLFILLAANFTRELLGMLGWRSFLVLAVVLLVLRPLGVFVSSIGSKLTRNERLFLAWIAPRGIVAAAVSSLFAIQLIELGYTEATILQPLVFLVIAGTVLLQGGTAKTVAQWLGVSEADPQGFLFMGSTDLTRQLAQLLDNLDYRVLIADTNYESVAQARLLGIEAYHGNILSEAVEDELDLTGIGHFLAMTRNDEANSLACKHMEEDLGSSKVFQLSPHSRRKGVEGLSYVQLARPLFHERATYERLADLTRAGATVKKTSITPVFTHAAFRAQYPDNRVELMVIHNKQISVITPDQPISVPPGSTLISLIVDREKLAEADQKGNHAGIEAEKAPEPPPSGFRERANFGQVQESPLTPQHDQDA